MTPFIPSQSTLDYAQIFDARGRAYHEAMTRWPRARDEEFQRGVALAKVRSGQLVVDFPSGGGYLARYLPDARLVLVETSRVFFDCSQSVPGVDRRWMVSDRLPLDDNSVDRVVSIAGLHHVGDKLAIYREFMRVLRRGGRAMIADVRDGSPVARFLNKFVHEHSDEGHAGMFLDERLGDELHEAGLVVSSVATQRYPWRFPNRDSLLEYCRLLFGITRATREELWRALREDLGVCEADSSRVSECHLNWELRFAAADKP